MYIGRSTWKLININMKKVVKFLVCSARSLSKFFLKVLELFMAICIVTLLQLFEHFCISWKIVFKSKVVFCHKDYGIKVISSKVIDSFSNFWIFVSVYIVNSTFIWNSWEVRKGTNMALISVKVVIKWSWMYKVP